MHCNPPLSFSTSSETYIASALRDGTAIAVSDGSYKEEWGLEALIIEGPDHATRLITATCTSPGHPKDKDAYRSELAGIFHMVSIVEEISRKFNIPEGAIMIACNGLSNHFDLISAIDHKILKYPLTWYWIYVKGREEDQTDPLDRWVSLNVECDTA